MLCMQYAVCFLGLLLVSRQLVVFVIAVGSAQLWLYIEIMVWLKQGPQNGKCFSSWSVATLPATACRLIVMQQASQVYIIYHILIKRSAAFIWTLLILFLYYQTEAIGHYWKNMSRWHWTKTPDKNAGRELHKYDGSSCFAEVSYFKMSESSPQTRNSCSFLSLL